jgi:multisubunit Na+/H+ antiporter MnhG subunit
VNAGQIAVAAFLALAVLAELVACAGILVMRTPLQRLHYVGVGAVVATVAVALAISVSQMPYSGAGLKAWCIALVTVIFAPIVTHETGRAADARRDER